MGNATTCVTCDDSESIENFSLLRIHELATMRYIQTTLKKIEISNSWNKHCSNLTSSKNENAHRLAYILAHYQKWIESTSWKTLDTETEITCFQEFMDILENYSRPSMMDDYYAIKTMIKMENEDNYYSEDQKIDESKNNNSNEKQQSMFDIRAYIQAKTGPCINALDCKCYVRNRTLQFLDYDANERREVFFIRAEDILKYEKSGFSRFEMKEAILQSSLDVIHNYIFHNELIVDVDEKHSSKFVTEVTEEMNARKPDNFRPQKMKKIGQFQYSFGCETSYWLKKDPHFVPVKYPDLLTELTLNACHSLSILACETLKEQARDILKTEYGQSLRSNREYEWMKINGKQLIPKGSLITERHLIAVLAYTNHFEMQYNFKKHGFLRTSDIERDEDVRKRNSEIAHWSRAIYEVLHCWGSVMSRKKPLFHGINCKVLLNRFSHTFMMPTSLTSNAQVVQNFVKKDGCILVLRHTQEANTDSFVFDVSLMSDFPNEEERLIFNSKTQIYDILMEEIYQ